MYNYFLHAWLTGKSAFFFCLFYVRRHFQDFILYINGKYDNKMNKSALSLKKERLFYFIFHFFTLLFCLAVHKAINVQVKQQKHSAQTRRNLLDCFGHQTCRQTVVCLFALFKVFNILLLHVLICTVFV